MVVDRSTDGRWDIHTTRQIAAAKDGTLAVTILNSGSWLALLSQVGRLTEYNIGLPILAWGLGALSGTSLWIFIYRSTMLQGEHDFDRENEKLRSKLDANIAWGVGVAIFSLLCFAAGVAFLTWALI